MLKTILIALLLISPICFGQTIDPTLQINWGSGYVNNINNGIVAGAAGNTTINPAVLAAGTTGSVYIPAGYPGTDVLSGMVQSGTYTSGITATGSTSQTCTLTAFNNGSTATATVALTGTNTIAGGTALVITSAGISAHAAPTSATVGNGTATCSGPATIATAIATNPNGVSLLDGRPLSSPYTGINAVYAARYGATCKGVGHSDDTAAIQDALNESYAYNQPRAVNGPVAVVLPQGSCVITAPLIMHGFNGSLIGAGEDATYLVAYYTGWVGTNYDAIELTATGEQPGGASIGMRRIGGFSLIGLGNTTAADLPNTTGIQILNTSNIYGAAYGLANISFDHLQIAQFDTCVDAEDMINSQFQFNDIKNCRIGLQLNGAAMNNYIGNNTIDSGTLAFTSTTGGTTGFNVIINSKYGGGSEQPQGVYFYNNSVEDWTTGILDLACIACAFDYNQLDLINNIGMQVDENGIGGYGVWIDHNEIGMDTTTGTSLLIAGIADSGVASNLGFWVEDNQFELDNYPGNEPSTNVGISIQSVETLAEAHITGNQCMGQSSCIVVGQDLQYSFIENNTAIGTTNYVVNLAGAASLNHNNTVVDQNFDYSAGVASVNVGSSTGAIVLYNCTTVGCTTPTYPTFATKVYTVSTLPAATSFPAGTQVTVSDATTFTPGTCTGSGSDYMIAITNGTTWSCH